MNDTFEGEKSDSKHHWKNNFIVRFLRFLFNLIKAYLIAVGLFVTLVPIGLLLFFQYLAKPEFKVVKPTIGKDEKIALEINLAGEIVSGFPKFPEMLLRFFEEEQIVYLHEMRTLLRRATKDERVKGIYVNLQNLMGSLTDHQELRELFLTFKQSNKPIYFYLYNIETNSYYLASVADFISMPPAAGIELTGPVFQLVYLADLLKKIGIQLEVFKAGKFKSALEPLVQNEPSKETLDMYKSMEQSIRSHIVENVAASQNKSIEEIAGWFKQSLYTPKAALDAKIISSISHPEAIKKLLLNSAGAEEFITPKDYLAATDDLDKKDSANSRDSIALIEAVGEIHDFDNYGTNYEVITPEIMRKQTEWAKDNAHIKSVVLRVSSPGGSANASDMIWKYLTDLAEKKPLIVSMGTYAASGGYYIAVPAHKIIAHPTTITGSIGVITAVPNLKSFKEKYGVSFYVITQSDRAKLLNLGEESSGFDKDLLSTAVEDVYQTFISRVAASRKMEPAKVDELGQGRVYTGSQALQLNLVDQVGSLQDAIKVAKELAGLDPEKLYPIETYSDDHLNIAECLKSTLDLIDCLRHLNSSTISKSAQKILVDFYAEHELSPPAFNGLRYFWYYEKYLSKTPAFLMLWPDYLRFIPCRNCIF